MSVVFAHDHNFFKYNGEFYSTGGISLEVLKRYSRIFDNVIVLSRQSEISKFDKNLTLSSDKNIEFVKISNLNSLKNIQKYNKAHKIIEDQIRKTDYVIARLPSTIGNLAVKYAKKNNKPYLIELVGCPWDSLWNHSIKGKLVAPLMYLTTKKIVKEANYVLYVTNDFLQNRYPSNGNTVNCSNVTLNDFDDNVLESRLKKISNLSENSKKIIGTTAALNVRYKGQQYVIKALGNLKKRGITNFEYQLVGGGDSTYLLSVAEKYNVSDQIKILGSLPNKEVFNWLKEIDIYAQPSETEGLPRALIEAMSKSLPAFGSEAGGIPELLEKKYVLSNKQKKVDEICNILTSFTRETMIKQARRNYEESKKYDREIIEQRRRNFLIDFKDNFSKS